MQVAEVVMKRGRCAKEKLSKEEYQRIRELVWKPNKQAEIDGNRDMVQAVESIAADVDREPVIEYLLFGNKAMRAQ